MAKSRDAAEPDARALADLSALADGTLDQERAAEVREVIAQSPELRRRYDLERSAVSAMRTLRADRAPASLRIAIDRGRNRAPRGRARPVFAGALAAVGAAAVAVILLLPGAASLTVTQAAAVALRGPVMPAPPAQSTGKLRRDVQDIYFPDWSGRFGWRASGQRIDRINGRLTVTVFYRRGGKQLAYTILASPALSWPKAQTRRLYGLELRSFAAAGRLIVTWRRANHTCVLSASGVSAGELSRLAAWKAPGLNG
jgi:hypothetical protein